MGYLRLVQLKSPEGVRMVAMTADDGTATIVPGYSTTYALAKAALRAGDSKHET